MYLIDPSTVISDATIRRWRSMALDLGAAHPSSASGFTNAADTLAMLRSDAEFVSLFGAADRAQFVSLLPSQQIVAHCDQPIAAGLTRWHVPVATNSGCWSFSVGTWMQLEIGRRYSMVPSEEHGAVNWGDEVRINLLVDAP